MVAHNPDRRLNPMALWARLGERIKEDSSAPPNYAKRQKRMREDIARYMDMPVFPPHGKPGEPRTHKVRPTKPIARRGRRTTMHPRHAKNPSRKPFPRPEKALIGGKWVLRKSAAFRPYEGRMTGWDHIPY